MNIRPMLPADAPACARIMAETPLWQRYGVSEQSARGRFECGLAEGATIAVAEIEGWVAGFVWYQRRGVFGRSGYIMLIGVAPGLYQRGVGAALMAYAEAELFREAADIFLLVSDFNRDARRFYERRGYRLVGRVPAYVLPNVDELIYHKRNPIPNERGQP